MNFTDPSGHYVPNPVPGCTLYNDVYNCVAGGKGSRRNGGLPVPADKPSQIPKAPEGVNAGGELAWTGIITLINYAYQYGLIVTMQDLLAFVIETEYLGDVGPDPNWNAAMARRYWSYCFDGAFTASCLNGFWGYMQEILNGNTTDLYKEFIKPNAIYKDLWNKAEAIANVILNPDEKNKFGITGDMKNKNACFGQKCQWADIKPGQNGDPDKPKSFGCVSFELKVRQLSGKVSLIKTLQERSHDFQLTRDYKGYSRAI